MPGMEGINYGSKGSAENPIKNNLINLAWGTREKDEGDFYKRNNCASVSILISGIEFLDSSLSQNIHSEPLALAKVINQIVASTDSAIQAIVKGYSMQKIAVDSYRERMRDASRNPGAQAQYEKLNRELWAEILRFQNFFKDERVATMVFTERPACTTSCGKEYGGCQDRLNTLLKAKKTSNDTIFYAFQRGGDFEFRANIIWCHAARMQEYAKENGLQSLRKELERITQAIEAIDFQEINETDISILGKPEKSLQKLLPRCDPSNLQIEQQKETKQKAKAQQFKEEEERKRKEEQLKREQDEKAESDARKRDMEERAKQYSSGVFIRVKGKNFVEVLRYTVEKLRCNLCNQLFVPEIPAEVGTEKYDASFKAILAILKYYLAVPFYRQENFQKMLSFPISDATQWDLIEKLAGFCYPIFNVLKVLAANGSLVHNDDTKLLILEVIKAIKDGMAGERTGMYTTGIVAENDGHKIALFMNGRQHSGENIGSLLQLRDPAKGPIMQMCDALSANVSHKLQVILCNCLSHGFRKFEEIVEHFETECIIIMEKLSKVYDYDALTRDMQDAERLTYHQTHSKPVMDELKAYMDLLLEEHRVEPNSELGKAIRYMQNHWQKLTKFLTVPGAPIENNIVERALKIAIRNRKSSMFYRTIYSANIGGMLTSIIYTCDLAGANPHHYLTELQHHTKEVFASPEKWLPWNYQETMAVGGTHDANPPVHSPPLDCLAAA